MCRWKGQGFVFNDPASSTNFGLIQQFGGPCGVLASLQGFLIGRILFEGECKTDSQDLISKLQLVTEEEQYLTLSHVMANRLCVIGEDIKRVALVLQGETEGEFQVLWLGNDIQTVEVIYFSNHTNNWFIVYFLIEFLHDLFVKRKGVLSCSHKHFCLYKCDLYLLFSFSTKL